MQLFVGERYPLHIYCHRITNLKYLFDNWCLITLERDETPIGNCSVFGESLQFDQCFRHFFSHLQQRNFDKVKFTDTSNAGNIARKSQKYFDLSAFNLNLNHPYQ